MTVWRRDPAGFGGYGWRDPLPRRPLFLVGLSALAALCDVTGFLEGHEFAGHLITEFCWLAVALFALFRILLAGGSR